MWVHRPSYNRRIVGWAIADHPGAELVIDALEMAVARRRPATCLVHHSDQGSSPVRVVDVHAPLPRRRERGLDGKPRGLLRQFPARGPPRDDQEGSHRRSWPTKAEMRTAVFDYIEAFYG
jgi:putative transposase